MIDTDYPKYIGVGGKETKPPTQPPKDLYRSLSLNSTNGKA